MRLSRPLLLVVAALLAACRPWQLPPTPTPTPSRTPVSPTPIIQCTPPPCAAGEVYVCPSGDCPGGCGTGCATVTPSAGLTSTPAPVCTPPPCWSGETYFCAGECPGGCGTTCATHTPDPSAPPPPTFPAPASVCALPTAPAGAPALAVCASAITVTVGEVVNILAEVAHSPEQPVFRLQGQDADGAGFFGVEARGEDQTRDLFNGSDRLALTAARASGSRFYLSLEARAPGVVTLQISAGPPFPALYAEPLTITIQAP